MSRSKFAERPALSSGMDDHAVQMKRSASPPPLQLTTSEATAPTEASSQGDGLLANWFKNEIIEGPDFLLSEDGVSLNSTLYRNMNRMCNYLIENKKVRGDITYNEGVRSPMRAHRWSTAYNIRTGAISTQTLRLLEGGKDLDGNVWYDPAWRNGEDRMWPLADRTERDLVVRNAESIWSGARANEGYEVGDPRRHPNIGETPVSTHVDGNAIDATIRWKGDPWSEEANRIVDSFDLKRPEADEAWHFEPK